MCSNAYCSMQPWPLLKSCQLPEGLTSNDSIRKDESIPIDPMGILWIEGHEFVEEDMGCWGQAHGGTGMARVRLEGGIDLAETQLDQKKHCKALRAAAERARNC